MEVVRLNRFQVAKPRSLRNHRLPSMAARNERVVCVVPGATTGRHGSVGTRVRTPLFSSRFSISFGFWEGEP